MVGVDWQLLGKAVFHYECAGFKLIDVPWSVQSEVAAVTCPESFRMYPFADQVLVGSAEQSFMQMQFLGQLPAGKYVACTPCFRNEPVVDDLHQKYFMKVELYSTEDDQSGKAMAFALAAQNFVKAWGQSPTQTKIVPTEEGLDLNLGGIEIGSYSSRQYDGFRWTCGTGLAEPRFTIAKAKFLESKKGR
jgi:hypothetical protein